MTRLPGRLGAVRAQNSSARTKFRKHKVILESVTQRRKKLRTVISFEAVAPPGYTFIPAGNPPFTTACKETCREQGLKVFTVTTTPHQNTHGLSQQVHRVGYHFPSTVVADKCMELGLYLSENGNVVPFERFGNKPAADKGDVDDSQITINTEARDVIRDLFPEIPGDDMNQIIKTAFQKGERKVGTAVELPLARRAQLAVVAHIRHVYTEYDKLLKKTSFQEARRSVEDSTLEKLVQWRGDDEGGMPALEDVFREVIVISDDEEEDAEDSDLADSGKFASDARDTSVQILPAHVVADKLDITANDESHHYVSPFPIRVSRKPLSHEHKPRIGMISEASGSSKVDRRGFSRYQAWDRAMDRYREKKSLRHGGLDRPGDTMVLREDMVNSLRGPHIHVSQTAGRPLTPIVERFFDPAFKGTANDNRPHSTDRFLHRGTYDTQDGNRIPTSYSPKRKAPDIIQFPDGSVFSKISSVPSHKRNSYPIDVASAPVFVAGPRIISDSNSKRVQSNPHLGASNIRLDSSPRSNSIIPSIERRESPLPMRFPLQHKVSDSNIVLDVGRGYPATQNRRTLDELSKGIDLIDLTEDAHDHSKRRRLEPQEISTEDLPPLSYKGSPYYPDIRGAGPQPAPLTMHNPYSGSAPDGSRLDRGSILRKDQGAFIRNESREQTNQALYYPEDILRGPTGSMVARPTNLIDTSGHPIRTSSSSLIRPPVDDMSQYRESASKAEGYLSAAPRDTSFRADRPVSSHHSRGSGSDDAVWRNKANSYRSQRRLLEARDPSWSMSMPQPSLHVSRLQRTERVSHSPARIQEDLVEQSVDCNIDTRIENMPQYFGTQNRRISSQPPVIDGQKKRDTLPASAMRRYEVQLEKSMKPHRHEAAPYQERQ